MTWEISIISYAYVGKLTNILFLSMNRIDYIERPSKEKKELIKPEVPYIIFVNISVFRVQSKGMQEIKRGSV